MVAVDFHVILMRATRRGLLREQVRVSAAATRRSNRRFKFILHPNTHLPQSISYAHVPLYDLEFIGHIVAATRVSDDECSYQCS